MAKKVKRHAWTKSDVRELKKVREAEDPAPKIARAMKEHQRKNRAKSVPVGVS